MRVNSSGREPGLSRMAAGAASAAVLGLGALACLMLNLPGHLSYDSVLQLAQGRSGIYNTWHPPVMAWLLGLGDAVVPGASLFVGLDVLLVFGALALFARAGGRASWLLAGVIALICASPLLVIYPAIVWKDVLFAASATAGFGALAGAGHAWRRPGGRAAWVAAALLLLVLAALARQNGAVVVLFGAASLGAMACNAPATRRRWREGLAWGVGFLAAAGVMVVAASAALNLRTDGLPERLHQVEDLQAYDIVGMRALAPDLPLEVLHTRDPGLERLLGGPGVKAYTPVRIDPLVGVPGLAAGRDRNAGVLGAQWRSLVLSHPGLYLRHRAQLFRWVLLTPQPRLCVPVYVGVDGPEPEMSELGLKPRASERDGALEEYGERFLGTPVLSHAAYAALGLCLLMGLLLRRRQSDLAAAAMLLAAFAFTASFYVLSVACDYRYLYFLDLSVIAAAVYGVASLGQGHIRSPEHPRQGAVRPPASPRRG